MSDLHGDGTSDARTSSGRASDTAAAILRDMPQFILSAIAATALTGGRMSAEHAKACNAWLKRRSDYLGIVREGE